MRLSCWVLVETVHYGLSVSWREVWPLWTLAFCQRLGGVQPLSRRQVLQLVKGWGKVQPSSRRGSAPTREGLGGCNPMPGPACRLALPRLPRTRFLPLAKWRLSSPQPKTLGFRGLGHKGGDRSLPPKPEQPKPKTRFRVQGYTVEACVHRFSQRMRFLTTTP